MHLHGEGESDCASGHKRERLKRELAKHLPFSIFAALLSVVTLGVLHSFRQLRLSESVEDLFHVFLPAHLLLSCATTTAMFWIHDRRLWKACLIGAVGSIGTCGIADILLPHIGAMLLGWPVQLHICFVKEPGLVYPFVALGMVAGILAGEHVHRSTLFSHFGHILVSSMAALLYPVAFGIPYRIADSGWLLLIVLVAVIVPCSFSDIVFPLLFAREQPPLARHEVAVTPPVENDRTVSRE